MLRSATRIIPAALATAMLLLGAASPRQARAAGAGWEESGTATWYGGRHNGRRTSSGAIFDDRKLTAAHPHLPLGSRIRVTVQDTGESIVVLVNDRQPPSATRVIDLSRAAAARIGLLGRGRGEVTITMAGPGEMVEPVEVAEAPAAESWDEPAPRRRAVRSARRGHHAAAHHAAAPRHATIRQAAAHGTARRATARRL